MELLYLTKLVGLPAGVREEAVAGLPTGREGTAVSLRLRRENNL